MRYFLFLIFFSLTACTVIQIGPGADEVPSIEIVRDDLTGTETLRIPDVPRLATLEPQNTKLYFECEVTSLRMEAEGEPGPPLAEISKIQKERCEKAATRLLNPKFILFRSETSEKWIFRFEERRWETESGLFQTVLPPDRSEIWGTLSRFKAGEDKPYSHISLSGQSQYRRFKTQLHSDERARKEPLLDILIEALIVRGIAHPARMD